MKKIHYKTVFISDIHLWNPKNQSDKLIKFLNSITFKNLIIIWDFIDYRQLRRFWKRTEKEAKTLNYINDLAKNWVNVTYIQWNHDRKLKCSKEIKIENMSVIREMYYTTWKWKTYYVTHWDCLDWANKEWVKIWELWTIIFWWLFRIEQIWNKDIVKNPYSSISAKFENFICKIRMSEDKIKNKIEKFSKSLNCDWFILWHFHMATHYETNWKDYFNTWDRTKNCSAVIEDLKWNLKSIKYKDSNL